MASRGTSELLLVLSLPADSTETAFRGPGMPFSFRHSAEVRDEDTREVHRYTVVGPAEADGEQRKLSVGAPDGKALLDQPAGATVEFPTPRGTRRVGQDR